MPPRPHPRPAGSWGPRRLPECPAGSPVPTDSTPEDGQQRARADFFLLLSQRRISASICPPKAESQAAVQGPSPAPQTSPHLTNLLPQQFSKCDPGNPWRVPPGISRKACKGKTVFIVIQEVICLFYPLPLTSEHWSFLEATGHVLSQKVECRIKYEKPIHLLLSQT